MKQVLASRGTGDRTLGIHEDLSWGPIGDERIAERIDFMRREVPTPWDDYWDHLPQKHAAFRSAVDDWADEILIWLGSASALELAGCLAFLERFSQRGASVIRPDEHLPPHPRFGPPGATGVLNNEQMAECLDHAPRRPISEDAALFDRWAELVDENAHLRVLRDGALVSAPIDAYDHFILGAAKAQWMPHVRLIGYAMGATFDARTFVSDDILFSRLAHLVERGVLEADGDVRGWTDVPRRTKVQVRLASGLI